MQAAYSILGSLNILGNPSQIVRNFSGDISNLTDHADNTAMVIAGGAGLIAKNTIGGYACVTQGFRRSEQHDWQPRRSLQSDDR